MIVQHFLKWSKSADVAKRSAAASALARAYLDCAMEIDERCAADAAMVLLLEDPSPKVRLALAEALSASVHAPAHIVTALACDQAEIAGLVIARSPVLRDEDLIKRIAVAGIDIQQLIANRPEVSNRLALALSERAAAPAVVALLENPNAGICDRCLTLVADRHIGDADIRGALLEFPELPAALRLKIMHACSDALSSAPLIGGLLGASRAGEIANDAAAGATVHLTGGRVDGGIDSLIEELRVTGALTTKLLIRALCNGNIDFVAHALADLSGQPYKRVTAILVDERQNQMRALLQGAGLARSVHPLFQTAIAIWREVANGRLNAGSQEVTRLVLEDIEARMSRKLEHANDDIVALLSAIHMDMLRENARRHALGLAAA
ncbi:DUF2336 domain-containing protein [Oricola sp.]|uniref:DUF2336 domain-containing protein n=1 Tax=Oricola sp. TaxID=1979950 RepID=UPI003BAB8DF0